MYPAVCISLISSVGHLTSTCTCFRSAFVSSLQSMIFGSQGLSHFSNPSIKFQGRSKFLCMPVSVFLLYHPPPSLHRYRTLSDYSAFHFRGLNNVCSVKYHIFLNLPQISGYLRFSWMLLSTVSFASFIGFTDSISNSFRSPSIPFVPIIDFCAFRCDGFLSHLHMSVFT